MNRRLSTDSMVSDFAEYTRKLPKRYSNLVIGHTCRCSFVGLVLIAAGSITGAAVLWSDIDLDFTNMMKSDSHATNQWDSFTAAVSSKASNSQGRRLQDPQIEEEPNPFRAYRATFDLFLGYEMKNGGNLLSGKVLREVRNFETTLRKLPGWGALCAKSESGFEDFCTLGMSMINYAFPIENQTAGYDTLEPQELIFNGEGTTAVPMSMALRKIVKDQTNDIIFPRQFNASDMNAGTAMVRSLFRFRLEVADYSADKSTIIEKHKQLKDAFGALFAEEVYPYLQEADLEYVHVFYDGYGVKSHEILSTLSEDIHFVIGSAIFVLFYMCMHTGSIFLSVMGLTTILLAIPSAYVLFALMSNGAVLTVASFLTLFLTIGLGADVIFVFTDFWHKSSKIGDIESRLMWTYAQAMKVNAATTLITAASLFASLLSALRPVREFGVLMGLCVVMVFVLVCALFPQFCVLDHRWGTGHRSPKRHGVVPVFFRHRWSPFIRRWKRTCVFVSVALSVIVLAVALSGAEADKGMPSMFPEDHNQVRSVEIFSEFLPIDSAAFFFPSEATSKVCSLQEVSDDCYLHWCQATDTQIAEPGSHCICSMVKEGSCSNSPGKGALLRIAGVNAEMRAQLESKLLNHLSGSESWSIKDLGSLVAQNWVTGETEVNDFVEAKEQSQADGDCYIEEYCYCGAQQCDHATDLPGATTSILILQEGITGASGTDGKRRLLNLKSEQEMSASLRQVVPRTFSGRKLLHRKGDAPVSRGVPLDQRADVVTVFGIAPQGSQPLLGEYVGERWTYLNNFDPSDPWAQRAMYKLCKDTPWDLLVADRTCWIADFHVWLVTEKSSMRFPLKSRDFTEKLLEFSEKGRVGVNRASDFMWIKDGKLKGAYFEFQLDYSKKAEADETLNLKGKWDAYIQTFNQDHSDSIRGIWHASTLWVRAEAETEILGSTLSVVLLAVALAFLTMLIFTQDLVLSIYVVLSTLGVIACLAFFIIIVMGWDLGAIEVIALILFTGYAVTYSLHIAYKYGSNDLAEAKAKKAAMAAGTQSQVVLAVAEPKEEAQCSEQVTDAAQAKSSEMLYQGGDALTCMDVCVADTRDEFQGSAASHPQALPLPPFAESDDHQDREQALDQWIFGAQEMDAICDYEKQRASRKRKNCNEAESSEMPFGYQSEDILLPVCVDILADIPDEFQRSATSKSLQVLPPPPFDAHQEIDQWIFQAKEMDAICADFKKKRKKHRGIKKAASKNPASSAITLWQDVSTPVQLSQQTCCSRPNAGCAPEVIEVDIVVEPGPEDRVEPENNPEANRQAGMVQDPAGPAGQMYQGQVVAGMKHGTGVLEFEIEGIEGNVVYQGEFCHNKRSGHGVMLWPDGRKYVGQFENDELHGEGTMYWPDGRKYMGQYRHDMENGQGFLTTPSGGKFIGQFEQGKRNGKFLYVQSDDAKMRPVTMYFNMDQLCNAALDSVESEFTSEELTFSGTQSRSEKPSKGAGLGSFEDAIRMDNQYKEAFEKPMTSDKQDGSHAEAIEARQIQIGKAAASQSERIERAEDSDRLKLEQIEKAADEERFERTRYALQSMGRTALGSAVTTVGSSFFLLFCTLAVFSKLGSIAIMFTFLSILYALLPLPAILIDKGPLAGKHIQVSIASAIVRGFDAFIHAVHHCLGLHHDEDHHFENQHGIQAGGKG